MNGLKPSESAKHRDYYDRAADAIPQFTVLNYGFSSDPEASVIPQTEPEFYCLRLYEHTVRDTPLAGRDVLEVSCGRGGGASFVSRTYKPQRYVGIDVSHVYAVTFGLGTACLAVAACLLMPTFYVTPRVGNAFVLVAFTIVVLGGMGSILGALLGGLIIGVVESLCGLYLGESLGQIGIFLIFILVLLVRPTGLFGAEV